jgi:hypothetical protein
MVPSDPDAMDEDAEAGREADPAAQELSRVERRAAGKAKRALWAEMKREGKPPPPSLRCQYCHVLGASHWDTACPEKSKEVTLRAQTRATQRAARKALASTTLSEPSPKKSPKRSPRKRTKRKRGDEPTEDAPPSKRLGQTSREVDAVQIVPTRREAAGATSETPDNTLWGDGTWLTVACPEWAKAAESENMIQAISDSIGAEKLKGTPTDVRPMGKGTWGLRYQNELERLVALGGKVLFKGESFGKTAKHVSEVKLLPYVTHGPQAYYLKSLGGFDDLMLQRRISEKFPDRKFWYAKRVLSGMADAQRILVFERPMAGNQISVTGVGMKGYEVRFYAANRTKCDLCKDEGHFTGCCPQAQGLLAQAGLSNVLTRNPLLGETRRL